MKVYSATDVGQKRKMNQDYVFTSEDAVGNLPNLFVVADGMGGHNAGDFASSHAVEILVDEIRKDADYNPVKVIRHAIETANTEIIEQAQKDESLRGMGTTMVVSTIVGQYALSLIHISFGSDSDSGVFLPESYVELAGSAGI